MKKEVTVCFRTSEDLRRALEGLAKEERRSLSAIIELILTDSLRSERDLPARDQQERRRYPRKAVAIPAYVTTRDSVRHGAVVLDLSLGGMRLSLPKEAVSRVYENEKEALFDTSFILPDLNKSIQLVCKPERVVPLSGDLYVGASFVDAAFGNYQNLQQFLM